MQGRKPSHRLGINHHVGRLRRRAERRRKIEKIPVVGLLVLRKGESLRRILIDRSVRRIKFVRIVQREYDLRHKPGYHDCRASKSDEEKLAVGRRALGFRDDPEDCGEARRNTEQDDNEDDHGTVILASRSFSQRLARAIAHDAKRHDEIDSATGAPC